MEVKTFKFAVKRNINRFSEDFCFQLTKEEDKILKCQIGTSKILDAERTDIIGLLSKSQDDNSGGIICLRLYMGT